MSIDEKSSYYDVGGIETIDVIRAKLTPEQFTGYCLGNIIKYSSRLNYKYKYPVDQVRDAEKITTYANMLHNHVAAEASAFTNDPRA